MELKWTRKSLPNKAVIVDLIAPHECDERHVENITDAEVPVGGGPLPAVDVSTPEPDERTPNLLDPTRDRRSEKDIKSTAPQGAVDHVKQSSGE
jgi:hypothetical protein